MKKFLLIAIMAVAGVPAFRSPLHSLAPSVLVSATVLRYRINTSWVRT